jgi:hypothetical protein
MRPSRMVIDMINVTSNSARRLKSIVGTSILGATAVVALTPIAAHAQPTGCSRYIINNARGTTAWCTSGTGEYRAVATCHVNVTGGGDFKAYGGWAMPNTTQGIADCGTGNVATYAGIGYR